MHALGKARRGAARAGTIPGRPPNDERAATWLPSCSIAWRGSVAPAGRDTYQEAAVLVERTTTLRL